MNVNISLFWDVVLCARVCVRVWGVRREGAQFYFVASLFCPNVDKLESSRVILRVNTLGISLSPLDMKLV